MSQLNKWADWLMGSDGSDFSLLKLIAWPVSLILYVLVGAMISLPYTLLAAGDPGVFAITLVFGPPVLLLLSIGWIDGNLHDRRWYARPVFWSCTLWALLPILMSGVSLVANTCGYTTLGDALFILRYWSLGIALILAICVGCVWYCAKRLLDTIPRNPTIRA